MAELEIHKGFALKKLGEELFHEFLIWAKKKSITVDYLFKDDTTILYLVNLFIEEREAEKKRESLRVSVDGFGQAKFEEQSLLKAFETVNSLNRVQLKNFGSKKQWGVVAKDDLQKLDPIIEMKPSLFVTLSDKVCSFCGIEQVTVKCKECNQESYCGTFCKTKAYETYHKVLCSKDLLGLIKSISKYGQWFIHFPLFICKIFARMVIENKTCWKQLESLSFLSGFKNARINLHEWKSTYEQVSQVFEKESFSKFINFDDYIHLISILVINVFAWYSENATNKADKCLALFYPGSFFNHSCKPNCEYYFQEGSMYFISTETIKQGQEIFVTYIDNTKSYEERKKSLQVYEFSCNCILCKHDIEQIKKDNCN